eukprot:TRINITY_DN94_c0_g1_i3.p1 TRINITY_DN94_c0_g1~~TRINITY_DN94_c0_g1_i3.p1  ORF type:complete len:523 (+),score=36.77 TRINITY_DN94_c0_g1_i3:158-1726(+)
MLWRFLQLFNLITDSQSGTSCSGSYDSTDKQSHKYTIQKNILHPVTSILTDVTGSLISTLFQQFSACPSQEKVKELLATAPKVPIPVTGAHKELVSCDAELFKLDPFMSLDPSFEEFFITASMTALTQGSELSMCLNMSSWQKFWKQLFKYVPELSDGYVDTDKHEDSTTAARLRPDFIVQIHHTLVIKGEVKKSVDDIKIAESELVEKVDWEKLNAKLLFGFVCAGTKFHIGVLSDGHFQCLHTADLGCLQGYCRYLRIVINLVRIIVSLENHRLIPVSLCPQFRQLKDRNTSQVEILKNRIHKRILLPCDHVKHEVLLKVYDELGTSRVSEVIDGKGYLPSLQSHQQKQISGSHYFYLSLYLVPVGTSQLPRGESELRSCAHDLLCALSALHYLCVAHRDVRWANVIQHCRSPQHIVWILIDLEFLAPFGMHFTWVRTSPRSYIPPEVRRGNGCSALTDMFMLGVMLRERCDSTWIQALSLINSLCSENPQQRPTAKKALTDPWFLPSEDYQPHVPPKRT